MANPTGFVPGTAAQGGNLGFTTWMKTFFLPVHEKMVFAKRMTDGGKGYQYGKFRTLSPFSSTAITNTQLNYSANLTWQTPVTAVGTVTPGGYHIAVGYDDEMKAALEVDLNPKIRTMLEDCAAEAVDTTALALGASLTQVLGSSSDHLDLAKVRSAVAALRIITKGSIDPRKTPLQAVFHPATEPDLMSIEEMTHAEYRGDGESPLVQGFVTKGSGVVWNYTTAVYTTGGAHNIIFDPEAFLIMWNQVPKIEEQRDGIANLLISYANYGVQIARNTFAYAIKTASTLS
jgi:hypothetical protein